MHDYILVGVDAEAHHPFFTLVHEGLDLLSGQGQGVAHHATRACVILEVFDLLTLGIKLLGGVKGVVSLAGVDELLCVLTVQVTALALLVRAVVAALVHALVDADAQPLQGLVDVFLGTGHKACAVGVLDAQDHVAAVLTGKQVIIKCCAHAANVQRACG